MPEEGFKVLALVSMLQVVVKLCPKSLRCQMWEEYLVPGWYRCRQFPSCLMILSLMNIERYLTWPPPYGKA